MELLAGSATEADLLGSVKRTTQATGNRRLKTLEDVGLIARDAGKAKAPGRRWTIQHPDEVDALLKAALVLAGVANEAQEAERRLAERKLKRARAARLGIHEAGGEQGR
jgi:DNA-binding HxlR family transcriptional regulator